MARRCKVCWLHPRLRLWVENQLLTPNTSLREVSQQLRQHGTAISHTSLQRHNTGHMAPPNLSPTQKIDYYIAQLKPQQANLRKIQLLKTWIQQWQQLQQWHQARGEKEAAEADQLQIQELQRQQHQDQKHHATIRRGL